MLASSIYAKYESRDQLIETINKFTSRYKYFVYIQNSRRFFKENSINIVYKRRSNNLRANYYNDSSFN